MRPDVCPSGIVSEYCKAYFLHDLKGQFSSDKFSTGSHQVLKKGVLYLSMAIIDSCLVLDLMKSGIYRKLLKLLCSEFSLNKREHQEVTQNA